MWYNNSVGQIGSKKEQFEVGWWNDKIYSQYPVSEVSKMTYRDVTLHFGNLKKGDYQKL